MRSPSPARARATAFPRDGGFAPKPLPPRWGKAGMGVTVTPHLLSSPATGEEITRPARATAFPRDGLACGVLVTSEGYVGWAATSRGLRRLTLPQQDRARALTLLGLDAPPIRRGEGERSWRDLGPRLERHFAGEPVAFNDLPLDLDGLTPFAISVLEAVRDIPRGQVRSYGQVAASVGRPGTARAVGSVMAANPICIVVPCHRVIGSDGSLTGFGGGLELKRRLLEMEGTRNEGASARRVPCSQDLVPTPPTGQRGAPGGPGPPRGAPRGP